MAASTRRLNAITIANRLYHIVFTDAEGTRLLSDPDRDDTNVTLTTCRILGESLTDVAMGRALHTPPDAFQPEIGDWLSLARALDEGIEAGFWTFADGRDVLTIYAEFAGLDAALDALPDAVWVGDWTTADSCENETKVLILALQEAEDADTCPPPADDPSPRLVKKDAPIVWQCADGDMPDTRWVWQDGQSYYMDQRAGWALAPSTFSVESLDALTDFYTRVPDPRTPVPVAPVVSLSLSLNDQFRADAKRLGIPLESTVGALTMCDLCHIYYALKATRTITHRETASADAWWESTDAVVV